MASWSGNIETLMVCAIDFGTAYSGYAYSFLDDKEKVFVNDEWASNQTKTPTSILFLADKSFKSFGRNAENDVFDQEYDSCYFFKQFKMHLYDKRIERNLEIQAHNGKTMKAIDVFAASIKYLKDHFLRHINDRYQGCNINVQNVRWVLTIPAIWSNSAKQFMREAAAKAGIPSQSLLIGLEPECASMHCQSEEVSIIPKEMSSQIGKKYLVLDNGGGTIDATIHQIIDHKTLKSLHRPSGGSWGGTAVNKLFEQYLEDIFTTAVVSKIKREFAEHWLKIMRDFEDIKRNLDVDKEYDTIFLTDPFVQIYLEAFGISIAEDNRVTERGRGAFIRRSSLKIPVHAIIGFINDVAEKVKKYVEELMVQSDCSDIDFIIMVGGFSNSGILRQVIKDLQIADVYAPKDAETAVVKGAVLFGWNPECIQTRRSAKTYGISTSSVFQENVHPPKFKYTDGEGNVWCDNIFCPIVTINQELQYGEKIILSYSPVTTQQTSASLKFYASDEKKVDYCTDKGCIQLGCLEVLMRKYDGVTNRRIICKYDFSDTEINVTAHDETSGKYFTTTLDFLTTNSKIDDVTKGAHKQRR